MKKYILLIALLLFIPSLTWAACTGSSPTWTTDGNEWADVQECMAEDTFTAGDTVNVIAGDGTATWGAVTITKGVQLIGPGATNLTLGATRFTYTPSDTALNANFRITGFDIVCIVPGVNCILLTTPNYATPQTKVIIDNNTFTRADETTIALLKVSGLFWGVFTKNTINGNGHMDIYPGDNSCDWLSAIADEDNVETYSVVPGSARNFYVEDNVFTGHIVAASGGQGGRYCFRYNTYVWDSPTTHPSPWFDFHGNQSTVPAGSVLAEIYGNKLSGTMNGSGDGYQARGGTYRIFNNLVLNYNFSMSNREETCDSVSCSGAYVQKIHDSYNWANISNGKPATFSLVNGCPADPITANKDFFNYTTKTDGSEGTGCGSTLPGTCTFDEASGTGPGYWVTDQSCSSISTYVGASTDVTGGERNHAIKIEGTLYKCTADNTWTASYTPYAYPHPLRGGDTTAPTNQQAGNSISADGLTLTLNHSESITKTGDGTVALTCSGGAVTPTYSSGSGTANHKYALGRVIKQGEVCTVAYTQGGNDLEDVAGNDLATYTGHSIVNGSTVSAGGDTFELSVAVVGGGTVNSSQGGVQCTRDNTPCTKTVDDGTVITFTLVPFPGHNAGVITGTGCGSSTTVDAAKSCTVTFPAIPIL